MLKTLTSPSLQSAPIFKYLFKLFCLGICIFSQAFYIITVKIVKDVESS